jgi:transcriptional regulator with PAS, ATPase and Fis domain
MKRPVRLTRYRALDPRTPGEPEAGYSDGLGCPGYAVGGGPSLPEHDAEHVELCGILTRASSMTQVLEAIWLYASLNEPVLVQGETGTGKSLVARALHGLSNRAHLPFVTIECGALPESLIESELFGHERGAFTGADRSYPGRVEAARGGTLFLDEINSVTLGTQGKLLRFLEEGEFCRVGQQRPVAIDVRVIAASNVPLEQLVAAGRVRPDFFHRINVLPIDVPPLRERVDDIPLLVRQFLTRDPLPQRCGIAAVHARIVPQLCELPWPGNVRELFNVLRRSVVLNAGHKVLERLAFPPSSPILHQRGDTGSLEPWRVPYRDWMREREREYLSNLLSHHDGAARQAAAAGLPQRTLYRKIRRLGLG